MAHTSNLFANAPSLRLAERLQALSPANHKVIFQNSGTEANEAALKLVRRHAHKAGHGDRAVILAFTNSFHGRTMGAVSLTGQPHYHERFAPLMSQVVHVPFNDAASLEAAFSQHQVAGVFFESVQGEGGVLPLSKEVAATLGRVTQQHGALLVADEVQTGVARTGRFFGFEHDGLAPDIITLAKGLGGGFPIGATLVHPKAATLFEPGAHGSTFGGNAVCAAAANAVLDVVLRDNLVGRAAALGRTWQAALADVGLASRGRGLLLGVPLAGPTAPEVVIAMRDAGFLVGQAGKSVIRLAPPLVAREEELLAAVAPLARAALPSTTTP